MATTTSNLGLTLPAVSDAADIGVLNTNFQKLDDASGYGMGTPAKLLTSADDIHTLTVGGRYRWSSDAPQNAPATYMIMDLMFRDKSCTYGVANFYTTTPYPIYEKYGRIVIADGVWREFEWVNPPMSLGVEYRTTERWNGKVVYTCLVNCGNPVDGSTKSVNHNLTMTQCISCEACAISTAGDSFPVIYGGDSTGSLIHANVYANNGRIHVYTSGGYNESAIIYAKLRYVKD